MTRQRHYKRGRKRGHVKVFVRVKHEGIGKGTRCPLPLVATLEIHAPSRDKEGRKGGTRPPRCTRFEKARAFPNSKTHLTVWWPKIREVKGRESGAPFRASLSASTGPEEKGVLIRRQLGGF